MDICNIDRNLVVETSIKKDDILFYNCTDSRFDIYGIISPNNDEDCFRRMPQSVADSVNSGVKSLNVCTAGGRLRLNTDSPYIAINAELTHISKMSHMALTGSIGFDLYEVIDGEERYVRSFVPPFNIADKYESVVDFPDIKERELIINFPLYSGVKRLYIGLSDKANIVKPQKYTYEVPVVYYGSSITQGGCASRPGNSYQQMISRRLHCDYVNLGFSGNARGEKSIAEYISKLEMSVFVYDYDHNAPSVEHLKNTHKAMFDIIRSAQPKLPIIMVTKPSDDGRSVNERAAIIKDTYNAAIAANDGNVYFLDGVELVRDVCGDNGTVDGIHPNDWGFSAMAKGIGDIVAKVIKNKTYIQKQ